MSRQIKELREALDSYQKDQNSLKEFGELLSREVNNIISSNKNFKNIYREVFQVSYTQTGYIFLFDYHSLNKDAKFLTQFRLKVLMVKYVVVSERMSSKIVEDKVRKSLEKIYSIPRIGVEGFYDHSSKVLEIIFNVYTEKPLTEGLNLRINQELFSE
jgi:hypothetical protein